MSGSGCPRCSSPGQSTRLTLHKWRWGIESRFVLGDKTEVAGIFKSAGVADFTIGTHWGAERFASPAAFVEAEIRSSPELLDLFDDESWSKVLHDAGRELVPYAADDGRVEFQSSGHTVTATKA